MRIIFLFLLISNICIGQSLQIDRHQYDSLVIVDEHNNNYNIIYGRIYKINLQDEKPELILSEEYKNQDSLPGIYKDRWYPEWDSIQNRQPNQSYGYVSSGLIDSLIFLINNPTGLDRVFEFYSIDSTWLADNSGRLIAEWNEENTRADKLEKQYAEIVLNDYNRFKQMAFSHILQSNSSGYNNTVLAFENERDTTLIYTDGQESFLLPWRYDTTYRNYNPFLSALISQILPTDLVINKMTLSPGLEEFEDGVLDQLTFKSYFINRKEFRRYLRKVNKAGH